MNSTTLLHAEPSPITACTVSRDVQNFDLLIEDMEAALGEAWGDLGFAEALAFFQQPESEALEFIALAINEEDEDNLPMLGEVISAARRKKISVILIAEDVTPSALHQLLRQGANEFVPYPLPENELQEAIDRIRQPAPGAAEPVLSRGGDRNGVILAVQGLAGGTGASTMAVNLAWELANVVKPRSKEKPPKVCILDLDLQFGTISTYLDLPRRDAVYELLSDTEAMDDESFGQALLDFQEKVQVLTSPADILPLDLITPADIDRLLTMAASHFDYVIVDMPTTLVQWTETVLARAHVYFAMVELEMRSAQNAMRLKRALQSEDLPFDKLRFVLNRAPKFTDLNGKSRVKRMADSLGITIDLQMPDGGKPVVQAGDHGSPLALAAGKNPLRREIAKLALSLHELGKAEAEAA